MNVWEQPDVCELCGHRGPDVRWGIVYRPEADPGMNYEQAPKCLDHAKCKARVLAAGLPWPEPKPREAVR